MLKPAEMLNIWISMRVRTAYRQFLKFLPISPRQPKPEQDLVLLTMTGSKYLELLQQCLLSLYKTWSTLPKLHVVSDGTITTLELEKALKWWPNTKYFSSWEQSVDYHNNMGRKSLVQYAHSHFMGKKLAVILASGEQGSTLWCDSDILWFREISGLPRAGQPSGLPTLKMSEDYQSSYDEQLINYGLEHLSEPPYRNAGFLHIQGNLLEHCNLQHLIDLAAEDSGHSTEQTIFAEAAYQLGGEVWSNEEVACFEDDKLSLLPDYAGKNWFARHYVGPVRHLFWRDALILRLGLKNRLFKALGQPELLAEAGKISGKGY
jgi:hypothetical protein